MLSLYSAPSPNLMKLAPCGWMEKGMLALFFSVRTKVSPTSTRSTGPRKPRCSSSSPRVFCLVKVTSSYSLYNALVYTPPTRVPSALKNFSEGLVGYESRTFEQKDEYEHLHFYRRCRNHRQEMLMKRTNTDICIFIDEAV